MSKTIIVSNRLPVKITEKEGEYLLNPSEGGLATGLGSIYRQGYNIWIGWPGVDVNEDAQPRIKEQLSEMNLMPVYLTQEEIFNYYEGFSNEILSTEAVTVGEAQCLSAASAAAISIQYISLPPIRLPKTFVSLGNTSSVITTNDS